MRGHTIQYEWTASKEGNLPLTMPTNGTPRNNELIDQACAVPYRRISGRIEFCLITSSAGRWLFPKGVVDPGESYAETALKEAYEEAGLHGRIVGQPLGSYQIRKNGTPRTVVAVAMEVVQADEVWDEAATRLRQWVSHQEAHDLLSARPALSRLLNEAMQRHGEPSQ